MSYKYDEELLGKLWGKHSYIRAGDYVSNRKEIIRDYEEITGDVLPEGSMGRLIAKMDRAALYNAYSLRRQKTTFNQRTDAFIDEPSHAWTEEALLRGIGLDPTEFELVPHGKTAGTINHYWMDRGELIDRIRNGQVKLNFQKREAYVTAEAIAEAIDNLKIPPFSVIPCTQGQGMMSLFLTDMHFGFMKLSHYLPHRQEIINTIKLYKKEETVIVVGSDMFHVDNSMGTTTGGTQVGFEVSKLAMYNDGMGFVVPIIEEALMTSERVKVIFLEGNHDRTTGFGFAYALSKMFPQVEFDLGEQTRKAHVFRDVLIVYGHGDLPKSVERMHDAILEEFRDLMLAAKTVEVHLGHRHHRWMEEKAGTAFRGFSSPKWADKYHYDNGFIGAKRMMNIYYFSDRAMKNKINIDGYYYVPTEEDYE